MLNVKNRAFLIELLNRQALNVTLVSGNERLSTLEEGLSFLIWDAKVCEAQKSHRLISGPLMDLELPFPGLCGLTPPHVGGFASRLVSDLWPAHCSRFMSRPLIHRPLIHYSSRMGFELRPLLPPSPETCTLGAPSFSGCSCPTQSSFCL